MSSNLNIKKRCEFCKNEFVAKTISTRYCSHKCNSRHYKILSKQKTIEVVEKSTKLKLSNVEEINKKDFLTAKEASFILNMSLRTLYRLIENKQINSYNFGTRKTLIRRKDIDLFFELSLNNVDVNKDMLKNLIKPENSYTVNEILEKYKINSSTLYGILKKLDIPKKQFGKFVLVKKEDIHSIFECHD